MKVADNTHLFHDQFHRPGVRFCSGFYRGGRPAGVQQALENESSPAHQLLVFPGFIVSAERQTDFFNQCLIFTHGSDYNKTREAVL